MYIKSSIIVLISLFLTVFYSCKKDKTNNNEETELLIEIQKNDAESTKIFNLITDEINDISNALDASGYSNAAKPLDSCIQISINHPDTTTWPKTMVINFSGNCTSQNGNLLTGQIIIHQTARYRVEGMTRTISLNGFAINGYQVSGTKTIVNNGLVNGFITYSVSISDGSIITPYGEVIATRSAQRTRTWIEGESTPVRLDDVYSITGFTSGTTKNGRNYVATIVEPLIVARNCRWIKQGKISTVVNDLPVVVIHFGDGSCDQIATITVNGNTRTITLRN